MKRQLSDFDQLEYAWKLAQRNRPLDPGQKILLWFLALNVVAILGTCWLMAADWIPGDQTAIYQAYKSTTRTQPVVEVYTERGIVAKQ